MIANALKYSKKLVYSYFILVSNRVWFWVKCHRKGLKILNSVLNGIGKSENCVLNRVRVWTPGPHLPTQASVKYPPPPWSRVTLRITRTFLSLYVFQCFAEIQGKAFVIHLSFEDRNSFYIDCFSIVNRWDFFIYLAKLGPRGHRLI